MTKGRVIIIPFLHGELTAYRQLVEPDIDNILEKWLEGRGGLRKCKLV